MIVSFNREASKDEMAREIDRCHAVIEKYEAQIAAPSSQQAEAVPATSYGEFTPITVRADTTSPSPADAGEPDAIAEALAKADWPGVSIGNKALI